MTVAARRYGTVCGRGGWRWMRHLCRGPHPPGHAQADFGEAWAIVDGRSRKVRFLVVDLPQSDAAFVKAYPAETAEAFCRCPAAHARMRERGQACGRLRFFRRGCAVGSL